MQIFKSGLILFHKVLEVNTFLVTESVQASEINKENIHSNLVMKKFEFYCYSALYDLFLTASNKSVKNDSAVFQICILAAILVFFVVV